MLKNFFISAFRNLKKQSGSVILNITGLATGLTVFLFIALYVINELSYDRFHENYKNLPLILNNLNTKPVDGILLDLGVSSYQLLSQERGFSFQSDAVLDMRMDRTQQWNAADLINNLPESELAGIIYRYGEERLSRRIVNAEAGDAAFRLQLAVDVRERHMDGSVLEDRRHRPRSALKRIEALERRKQIRGGEFGHALPQKFQVRGPDVNQIVKIRVYGSHHP